MGTRRSRRRKFLFQELQMFQGETNKTRVIKVLYCLHTERGGTGQSVLWKRGFGEGNIYGKVQIDSRVVS